MSPGKLVQFTLNGKTLTAEAGTLVIDSAAKAGVTIPHYCYHPALGNPGNCRLCIVEVEGALKPAVSCRLEVKEGLVVRSDSELARRAQQASLEFHLMNHPLDCPVCDQSGECALQDYYMEIGQYPSRVKEDKFHKEKRVVVGPHVVLDQERCILCTRCTRFVDQVTGTHELGLFNRGFHQVIDLAPGKVLDNPYSGNVVDICPVGALTDLDFRFQVRVWYLDRTSSTCPGCARGCAISIDTSTRRNWHNQGRRVARIKPRFDPEVNGYWICDEGRYHGKRLDEDRLGRVLRLRPERKELSWNDALSEVASAIEAVVRSKGPDSLAVVASGELSNEDWAAFRPLFVDVVGARHFLFTPEPEQVGEEDEILRRREKVPNLKGGEAQGFGTEIPSATWDSLASRIESGSVSALYIVDRDAFRVWGPRAAGLFDKLELVVYQGPYKGLTGDRAHFRLPATAYIEEEGSFTNFQGHVGRYDRALEPLGDARPDWWIFDGLRARLRSGALAAREANEVKVL